MKDFKSPQFREAFCYALAETFNQAYTSASQKPYSLIASMFKRYEEAFAKKALFFGPLAVYCVNEKEAYWHIEDLRDIWGYNPIHKEFWVKEGQKPTIEDVLKALHSEADTLRHRAQDFDALIASFQAD